MGFDFRIFGYDLDEDFVDWLIDFQYPRNYEKYSRFWSYYQNPSSPASNSTMPQNVFNELSRNYVQAQEAGLPARITGIGGSSKRKEIVIENDIAWRINTMVDHLFGKGLTIFSKAPQPARRQQIDSIIKQVFKSAGGFEFFNNLAVLGGVYGFVDCILRVDALFAILPKPQDFSQVLTAAAKINIDLVEAAHCLAVVDETNYKKIKFYIQHFPQVCNSVSKQDSFLSKIIGSGGSGQRDICNVTEIISDSYYQLYYDGKLMRQDENLLGELPVVHIQNITQPCYYEGTSDVEPLIPLQDELNTRLSDRANRITLQSFKMYLAKGIEAAGEREVMPGMMWCTDNEQAEICEFGGDAAAGGEDAHIQQVREALDKVSGVSPVAAGVIRGKLGNLTSAVALRMTLLGALAKTERKRLTYGEGIKQLCRLVLAALDKADIYKTDISEREFELRFPNPLPEEPIERLNEAKSKIDLGIPKDKVLEELGY